MDALAPETVTLAMGYSIVTGIVADEQNAYFIEQGKGGVHAVPLAGGPVTDLATASAPTALALMNGAVYWTDTAHGTIAKIAVAGGPPSVLAIADPIDIAATAGGLRVVTGSPAGGGEIQHLSLDLTLLPMDTVGPIVNPFMIAAASTG